MTKKILKCPYCNSEARLDWYQIREKIEFYNVWCDDGCGMIGPQKETREEAIEAWNSLLRK